MDIVECPYPDFKYQYISKHGKFYFDSELDNIDFKCVIPVHGDITIFSDKDRKLLKTKLENGKVIDKDGNSVYISDSGTVKEFRTLIPKKDKHIIKKKVVYKKKEIRYQYRENGDIEFHRLNRMQTVAILQLPRVYNDKGELGKVTQRMYHKKDAVYHIVTIDPTWFKAQEVVYYDDPFTITNDANFDGGTKVQVETHTDFPNHLNDKGVPPGCLEIAYGDRYEENFETMTWGQSIDTYDSWVDDITDSTSIRHSMWPRHNYCNDKSAIRWDSSLPAGGGHAQCHKEISGWDDSEELIFYWKYHAQMWIVYGGPGNFDFRTYDGDPEGAGNVNAHIRFGSNGNLWAWDDGAAAMVDSTEAYLPETWYRVRITHNNAGAGGNGTYRAYVYGIGLDPEVEVTDGAQEYEDAAGNDPSYIDFDRTSTANLTNVYYVDSIKIDDYEASGNWQSNTIEIEPQYRLEDFTVTYLNADADNYVVGIEWLIGADVIADYTTQINDDANSPFTITETDLNSGSFKDIEDDFTVKIYLATGTQTESIRIRELSGNFEYVGFETTTTSQFEDGTLSDIETYNDFKDGMTNDNYGVPEDEIHPLYGDDWDDNFEGVDDQTVGIQYRADDYTQIATSDGGTMIIASDQEYSGDHSCKFTYPTGNGLTELDAESDPVWAEGDNTYHYMVYWRCHNADGLTPNRFEYYIRDAATRAVAGHLEFQETLDIIYADDGGDHDSGQNYEVDTWYRIRVEMYSDSDTWEAWILGGGFTGETSLTGDAAVPYKAGTGVPGDCSWRRVTTDFEADNAEYWLDNFKLAEYVAASDWTSPTYEGEDGKYVKNTTVTYTDTDADAYIDKIEWYDTNDVLIADYTTNITAAASSPLTINNEDLTRGSFTDLDGDFYIKVYFVVVDLDTCPKLQKIGGQFSHEGQFGQIDCEVKFTGTYENPDWLDDWAYRRRIKVNRSVIDEDMENFPVLLKLCHTSGIDETPLNSIFTEITTNYQKLAVTLADGKTQCYVEVAKWDNTNKLAWLHVKAPLLRQHITDYIYIYYDSTQSNNTDYVDIQGTAVSHKVWSENYNIVHHMADDPDTSHFRDSSRFSHDATKRAANEPAIGNEGEHGWHQDFDGTDDDCTMGHNETMVSDALTVECMVRWDTATEAIHTMLNKERQSDGNMWFYWDNTGGAGNLWWEIGDGTARYRYGTVQHFVADTWYYLAASYEPNATGGNYKIYVNEVKETDETWPGFVGWDGGAEAAYLIGTYRGTFYFFDGDMAEIRHSNIARSEAWMKASYYNMTDQLLYWQAEEEYNSSFKTTLSSASNSLHTDDIWIESMQISHVSNRTPQCDLTITATDKAKMIARGDIIEVIREGDVYPFYGHVEQISQSTGTHSLELHCEGMMFHASKIPIRRKFYYVTLLKNLDPKQINVGEQFYDCSGEGVNFPVFGVQALHTTQKNFNSTKSTGAAANPQVDCTTGPPTPNSLGVGFTGVGGSPSTQINKIYVCLSRDAGTTGTVRISIYDDTDGQPNNEIAYIIQNDSELDDRGCAASDSEKDIVFDWSEFIITGDRNRIDVQHGRKYWLIMEPETTVDGSGMIIDWVSGNNPQHGDNFAMKTKDTTWFSWLQQVPEAGGGVGATWATGAYTRQANTAGAEAVGIDWWVGAKPVFEIEFESDWVTLKHGRDYVTERGSLEIVFAADDVSSGCDGLDFDGKVRLDDAGKFWIVRLSHTTGLLTLENAFKWIARDYMRELVDSVDVDISSSWTCGDWLINDSDVLSTIQELANLDRVSMRIFKDNLATPRITFEVRDKIITTDYTDYTTTEQNLRTFKSGANCTDMKERADQARIISASKAYDHNNRITRIFIRGANDEEEIVAVRTYWDDDEITNYGLIREETMKSAIITTYDDAMLIGDKVLEDYSEAPFEGEIVVEDARYDSYKLYNDCNGLIRVVIDELDLDDWFEIDSITTTWDGGNNWTNNIALGDKTPRIRIPELEGWSRKFLRSGFPFGSKPTGYAKSYTYGYDTTPGVAPGWQEKQVAVASPVNEEDLPVETFDNRYIIVSDLVTEIGLSDVYMDIGISDANTSSDDIQSTILNGKRPKVRQTGYTYKGWTTYFAVFDKSVCVMDVEKDFPVTIREVALCTGDNPVVADGLTRRILKPITGTGYARDKIINNQFYHPEIIFSSSDKIYVFFDVKDVPP